MLSLLALLGSLAVHRAQAAPVFGGGSDSVVAGVTFTGTGGTITPKGLYTAGQRAGTFRVTATWSGISDTVVVRLVPASAPIPVGTSGEPAVASARTGIPFGAFGAWDGASLRSNTGDFTLGTGSVSAEMLVDRLAAARATHHRLLLSMTGGAHRNYLTGGVFDINRWRAKMSEYDTPAIKAAVADAVADGTIIGNSVMDEPQNTSAANSWGPAGTMTKEEIDGMCGYVKTMFPTMPVGVVHDHRAFEPDKSYRTCDFIVSQYRWSKTKGDIAKFRDDALALGRRDGISIAFSLNILDGGIPKRQAAECPIPETGGPGTSDRVCRMTPQQIRDWGQVLGAAGCALTMWRYDPDFMSKPENVEAFKDVAAALAKAPARPCRRQ